MIMVSIRRPDGGTSKITQSINACTGWINSWLQNSLNHVTVIYRLFSFIAIIATKMGASIMSIATDRERNT